MKKTIIAVAMYSLAMNLFAQTEVTTQTFDLESIGKHKGYQVYSGYKNDNNNYVLKLGKPDCNSGTNYGLKWNFEELYFDQNLQYKKSESKSFDNTLSVLAYESIWGKKFSPNEGKTVLMLEDDWYGKSTVAMNLANGAISTETISSKVNTYTNNSNNIMMGCTEYPITKSGNSSTVKSEKGQRWIITGTHSFIGGGVGLYITGNVFPTDNNIHAVFKKFDTDLNEIGDLHIPFDFHASLSLLEVAKKDGAFDYIILAQAQSKYAPKGVTVKEADFVELVYIDGSTFTVKNREKTNLKFSNWITYKTAVSPDGSVYIFGAAGKDSKTYVSAQASYLGLDNTPKAVPNLQVMKLNNGEIIGIEAISNADAKSISTTISSNDVKLKGSSDIVFNMPLGFFDNSLLGSSSGLTINVVKEDYKTYFVNNKMIVTFQAYEGKDGSSQPDRGNMVTMVFDLNGKLLKYIIKPETAYSSSDEFFSADGKKMYWACYELNSLNEPIFELGKFIPKKIQSMVAGNLQFSTINLDTYETTIEALGADEWAVNATNPVMFDGETEIVFTGRLITKKAKDSELVLVKVKK